MPDFSDAQLAPLADAIGIYTAECRAGALSASQRFPPHTPGFKRIAEALQDVHPRYSKSATTASIPSELLEAWSHLAGLWSRTDFLDRVRSNTVNPLAEAQAIIAAVTPKDVDLASLVVIDGLDLPAPELVVMPGVRFVELTEAFLDDWFREYRWPGTVERDRVQTLYALEVTRPAPNPPWGPSLIDWESADDKIRSIAQPWLAFLNLIAAEKVRVPIMYHRTESLLVSDRVQAVGTDEPLWLTDYRDHEGTGDPVEVEERHESLRIQDGAKLVELLRRLEKGRRVAARTTHRVETSLRFFDRVSRTYWSHFFPLGNGDNNEANEDLIIDAVTALEAIYLGKSSRKKAPLAKRAGMFIEDDATRRSQQEAKTTALYEVRSAIVHGGEQRPKRELTKNAVFAEVLVRRSLRSFILLNGDQSRIARAAGNWKLAKKNRVAVAADFENV